MAPQIAVASDADKRVSEIRLPHLPLRDLGLRNVPALPIDTVGMVDTLVKLGGKVKQRQQALQGLSRTFTIGGETARANAFLYGREAPDMKALAAYERLRASLNRN